MRSREGRPARVAFVVLVCLAAVGGSAVLAAPPAEAAWTPYVNVAKQQDIEQPVVQMDSAGDTVFAWLRGADSNDPAIYTRVRTAAGTLSPVRRIASAFSYDLAVDPHGNAYYVWTAVDSAGRPQLRTRVRFADGTLSPVQAVKTIGAGQQLDGRVDVDASGTAVYAWIRGYGSNESDLLQGRIRSPSGALGAVHTIGEGGVLNWGFGEDFAVDASGNATFTWVTEAMPSDNSVHVFTRVLSLGPATEVSRAGRPGAGGQVVVTPSGRALLGWVEYDEASGAENLLVRARSADGDFQPAQVVTTSDDLQALPTLQLRIAPTGEAVIGWRTNRAWYVRTRASGGALGATQTITTDFVRDADLGIDSQGNLLFAWTDWRTDSSTGKTPVFVRTEPTGGSLSPTQTLSPAGYNSYSPGVAVSPAGDAAIGWQEGNQGWAIQAAFGP